MVTVRLIFILMLLFASKVPHAQVANPLVDLLAAQAAAARPTCPIEALLRQRAKVAAEAAKAAKADPAASASPGQAGATSQAVATLRLESDPATIAPRDEIKLRLELRDDIAQCIGGASQPVLYIDHLPLQGLSTTGRYVAGKAGADSITVSYRLDRTPESAASWNELLQRAWLHGNVRPVSVGIGLAGTELAVVPDGSMNLRMGHGGFAYGITAAVLCLILLGLAFRGEALRDRGRGPDKSYSLSRLILACWVLTMTAAIVLTLLHTGALPSLADGGLAFMVAAAGVGTGAGALIDRLKDARNPPGSVSVLKDLLHDKDGLAFHRVQSVLLNPLVLFVVWYELIRYGTVTPVDKSWSAVVGVSTLVYLLGKPGESADTAQQLRESLHGH